MLGRPEPPPPPPPSPLPSRGGLPASQAPFPPTHLLPELSFHLSLQTHHCLKHYKARKQMFS